jgi:nitrite reductase (NADH) small subunit
MSPVSVKFPRAPARYDGGMPDATQSLPVCPAADLPEGACAVITAGDRDVAVFHSDGQFLAIDDRCPHAGASLSSGHVEGGIVTCPWHAWRFRLCDGAWADNPKVKTKAYATQIIDGVVHVIVPPAGKLTS